MIQGDDIGIGEVVGGFEEAVKMIFHRTVKGKRPQPLCEKVKQERPGPRDADHAHNTARLRLLFKSIDARGRPRQFAGFHPLVHHAGESIQIIS